MAVEARHLNLFSPQLIPNRENIITNPIDASISNLYNSHMGNYSSSVLPLSGTTTTTVSETLLPPAPPYNSLIADSFPQKITPAMKSDVSTLTYNNNNNVPVQRKRSRDSINNYPIPSYHKNNNNNNNCGTFSFLGEDISLHIHHQQLHLDNLISQHMEKVRMELEEKRKRQARRLIDAIEVGMMNRVKAKEEEIDKIGKLNFALQERVKSLCIENQIWRDLAQTNEATANGLRTNLEQVLAQVRDLDAGEDGGCATVRAAALADDAESCCGSTNEDEDDDDRWRTLADGAQDNAVEGTTATRSRAIMNNNGSRGGSDRKRLCRNCGKEESCVLILPCRHLCLCTVCGSTLHTCPVCNSFKNASLHVNLT